MGVLNYYHNFPYFITFNYRNEGNCYFIFVKCNLKVFFLKTQIKSHVYKVMNQKAFSLKVNAHFIEGVKC